jgi:hypothetical protein
MYCAPFLQSTRKIGKSGLSEVAWVWTIIMWLKPLFARTSKNAKSGLRKWLQVLPSFCVMSCQSSCYAACFKRPFYIYQFDNSVSRTCRLGRGPRWQCVHGAYVEKMPVINLSVNWMWQCMVDVARAKSQQVKRDYTNVKRVSIVPRNRETAILW